MCNCNNSNPCIPNQTLCAPQVDCTCPVQIKSSCVTMYDGNDLECSGIVSGLPLNQTIELLDTYICEAIDEINASINLINVGTGEDIYAGIDGIGRRKIKRVNTDSNILTITPNTDDITFGIDEDALNTFVEANQKTYSIENIGDGIGLYSTPDDVVGDNTEFNFRSINTLNVGGGIGVIKEVNSTTAPGEVTIIGKTIVTDNLDITEEEDVIRINTPVSTSNLSFYVDENSTADTETGFLSAPFKTLNKALDTFIGADNGGTWYNPQYKGYKITLLSNCTLLETAGADYNGYVNLDINNLNIEGNGFYMSLNANPSPDYYPISTRRMVADMPKTANVLDYSVVLTFKNISIHRKGTNAVIDHLNYAFPTINSNTDPLSPQQPISQITLTDVIISNETNVNQASNPDWTLVPGVTYFGQPIYASNTAPIGVPMVKTEGRSWNGEGYFYITGNKFEANNSNGTCFKVVNTTVSLSEEVNISFNRKGDLRYYDTLVDGYYSPKTGLYFIEVDNNVNFFRIGSVNIGITIPNKLTTELTPRRIAIGGSDAMVKLTNNSIISIGGKTEEQYWNMFQFDGTSFPVLNNFTDSVSNSEDIHGVFKVIAPLPLTAIGLDALNTTLNQVITDETGVDKSYIQYLNGYNNTINNAPHSFYPPYADDVLAKAAGLIRGNMYFNTTISPNGALKIVQ